MLRRRFGGCQAIKQYTPCIHFLRDRNPVEIVLAEQSTAVLIQEGVSLKHPITSEGPNTPPEPTRRRQIGDLHEALFQLRLRSAYLHQMPQNLADLVGIGDHGNHLHG